MADAAVKLITKPYTVSEVRSLIDYIDSGSGLRAIREGLDRPEFDVLGAIRLLGRELPYLRMLVDEYALQGRLNRNRAGYSLSSRGERIGSPGHWLVNIGSLDELGYDFQQPVFETDERGRYLLITAIDRRVDHSVADLIDSGYLASDLERGFCRFAWLESLSFEPFGCHSASVAARSPHPALLTAVAVKIGFPCLDDCFYSRIAGELNSSNS